MKRRWWIYVLEDPRTGEVRYVGKTCNPHSRLRYHCKASSLQSNSHRSNWIRGLLADGVRPAFRVIDAGMGTGHGLAERAWIREYRRRGARLVNSTDGGEGVSGFRRRPESNELNRIAQTGRKPSEETRAKMSAARSGKPRSEATRAKMAGILAARNASHEQRAATSAYHRGRPKTAEQREKIRKALIGRPRPRDVVEKSAAAIRGRKHTPEAREKMSRAVRAAWKRRKGIA